MRPKENFESKRKPYDWRQVLKGRSLIWR